MILLRSLAYFALLSLTIISHGLTLATVGWLLPYPARSRISSHWARLNLWLLSAVCGLRYRLHASENLPRGAAIVMSKHQSAWETIALRAILAEQQAWVLKRELTWIPIFGWALAAAENIAIDRKASRRAIKQVITEGSDRLAKGRVVVIFPEGTRVAPGTRKRYGIGGALLAEKSGYPVVPIAHNAGVFWRRRDIRKYPGTIDIVVGPAIESRSLRAHEINTRVENWIETTVATLPQVRR